MHDVPAPSAQASASGDKRDANNALYFELGGPGVLYTVNYERAFGDFSARIGAGYFQVDVLFGADVKWLSVPVTLNYLGIESNGHALELGAGMTFYRLNDDHGAYAIGTAVAGYRYTSRGGFLFRAGGAVLFDFESHDAMPVPHLAFGAAF